MRRFRNEKYLPQENRDCSYFVFCCLYDIFSNNADER